MDRRQKLWRSAGVFGLYAALGPALGGLIVFAFVVAISSFSNDTGASSVDSLASIASTLVVLGFLFGGLPGTLTGAWLARKTFVHGWFSDRAAQAAAVVAILLFLAGLAVAALVSAKPEQSLMGLPMIAAFLVPVGLVCAHFCRWLALRFGLIAAG